MSVCCCHWSVRGPAGHVAVDWQLVAHLPLLLAAGQGGPHVQEEVL